MVELLGFKGSTKNEWNQFIKEQGRERIENEIDYLFPGDSDNQLVIDVSITDQEINQEINTYRQLKGLKSTRYGEVFMKRFECYQIWDEREKKTFDEIALRHKKNREEPLERTINRVKKQFHRACELIIGHRYDKQEIYQLVIKERNLLHPKKEEDPGLPQQHLLITGPGRIDIDDTWVMDQGLFDDPEACMYFKEIHKMCEMCAIDSKCRATVMGGDISPWSECAVIIRHLKLLKSH